MNRMILTALVSALATAASWAAPRLVETSGRGIRIDFDEAMRTRVMAVEGNGAMVLAEFAHSEYVLTPSGPLQEFRLVRSRRATAQGPFGRGRRWVLEGAAPALRKTVEVSFFDEFPGMAVLQVTYTNAGAQDLQLSGWVSHDYSIAAQPNAPAPAFWAYQSGSYRDRRDWIRPLAAGFRQENYLGMNATDYGGGTPVVDVWRRDAGLGIGHLERAPELVSLPVAMPEAGRATVALHFKRDHTLKPGEEMRTFRTFVMVHRGDCFRTLAAYRRAMERQGLRIPAAPAAAFEPIWCAWGFGRTFQPSQVLQALPVVKRLGFGWVTVDDGWQTSEGDWYLDRSKFPEGDASMRGLVDKIHAEGFKAQLWWAPLAADPGTDLLNRSASMLLLNADGSQQKISWWNAFYLCPADPNVVDYHRRLVERMLRAWNYDGLKLDGQHMNGVPPCYNPAHKHASPEDSAKALPQFFKAIYEAARAVKPDALIEFCPCGTAFNFFTLPYANMTVASDPRSSWQIRTKGKVLKALTGDGVAYFGDHVEMSEGGTDFASTIGVGGVVGSNFTWPEGSARRKNLDLTPDKERIFDKWIRIYKTVMPSRGEYLGALYDIGFDRPEAHVIRKGRAFYYAFFAPDYQGPVELRGLENRAYRLRDYAEGSELGSVRGPVAKLEVRFQRHLLVEAQPLP